MGLVYLGWGLSRSGHAEEGIRRQREGLQIVAAIGLRDHNLMISLALLVDSLLAGKRYPEGLELAARAFGEAAQTGERSYLSPLHQLRGELLLHAHGSADERVETELRQALAVAQEQDAKAWELRAATSLARLWAEQGRRAEAQALLAPVYGWFTEGFDTTDLKEAKTLLEELA